MLKQLKQQQFFCGVDLGTHTLKAAMVKVQDNENLDLLAVTETPALGMRSSSVDDLTQLSSSIQKVVNDVFQKSGRRTHAVTLGVSGDVAVCRHTQAVMPLIDVGTKVISRYDLEKVNRQAKLLGTSIDEEIIHDFSQMYVVDDMNNSQNPLGLMGRKIQSDLLIVLGKAVRLRNMTKAVHQAGFEVDSLSLSAVAAGDVVCDPSMRQAGVILMDIGAAHTTLTFYVNNRIADIQFIPWGGDNVTTAIAQRLSITTDIAQEIKQTHASASDQNEQGEILIKREKGFLPISRDAVREAVNWEIENFLTHVETAIKGSAFYHTSTRGIVMVGGGALLTGLIEHIEERTNLMVHVGVATAGLSNVLSYAAAIGLAQQHYLMNKQKMINWQQPKTFKDKMVNAWRDVTQEYF